MEEARRYTRFFGSELPEMLIKAGEIQNVGQYHEVLRQERKPRQVQQRKAQAEALKEHKIRLKEWRRFKTNYITNADGFDYLR